MEYTCVWADENLFLSVAWTTGSPCVNKRTFIRGIFITFIYKCICYG